MEPFFQLQSKSERAEMSENKRYNFPLRLLSKNKDLDENPPKTAVLKDLF